MTALATSTQRQHTIGKFLAVTIGFVMAALDITVVNIASATIKHDLSLNVTEVTWIVDGYLVTFAALLLLAGSLTGRYGAKPVYLVGLSGFLLASLGCALSVDEATLIATRLMQGAAAAFFLPASLVLLTTSFPQDSVRRRMIAWWSTAGAAASGVGPLVGGVLVDAVGWRGIFLLNLPLGLLTIFLTARYAPATVATPSVRLHGVRHVLLALGLAGLTFALIEGTGLGWGSPVIMTVIIVAVASWAGFVICEHRATAKVFPPELLRRHGFLTANGIGFFLNFGLYAVQFMLGLFLQTERGATPLAAGIQVAPMMLMFVIGNSIYARLPSTAGTRWPAVIGLAAGALSALGLTTISQATPYWLLAVVLAAGNLGIGLAVPAMTVQLMTAAAPRYAGIGSATFNATRQIGTLIGVATAGTLIAGVANWYTAARLTFLACSIAYALGSLLAALRPQQATGVQEPNPS